MDDCQPTSKLSNYCAVYRPSLTDSKLRFGDFRSLSGFYVLIPPSRPKRRDWLSTDMKVLHIEHQIWERSQGLLCYSSRHLQEPVRIPRLGVQLTILKLEEIQPEAMRWQGTVHMMLQASSLETMGVQVTSYEDLRKRWCFGDSDILERTGEDQQEFLQRAFGVRFLNSLEINVEGPAALEQLALEDGMVSGCWTISGAFHNPIDLSSFPFDTCSWGVLVTIIGCSPGLMYDWSSLHNFTEFDVFGAHGIAQPIDDRWFPYACEQYVVPNSARCGESLIDCRFYTRRKPFSKLLNVVFPVGLATILGVIPVAKSSGWLMNIDSMVEFDPLSFFGALLFTLVTVRTSAVESLPKGLGAATLLDKYMLSCMIIETIWMFLTAFLVSEKLDRVYAPIIYFCKVLVLHCYFGCIAWVSWRVPIAAKGEIIYDAPHEADEPIDWEYLHPGPRSMLPEVTCTFQRLHCPSDCERSASNRKEAL